MMVDEIKPHSVWLGALVASLLLPVARAASANSGSPSYKAHSRQKRVLWLTTDGRLALPPGTVMSITTGISMPFVRYPPDGFLTNISVSLPFSINFDKLGLTDNQNPYGVLPPFLGRSLGRSAGSLVADYISNLVQRRKRRDVEPLKPPPEANFHGGERAILYTALEDFITNTGYDGRACLLRTICEVHGREMQRFGLIGEVFKLFLTASQSPYSHVLKEYVEAEETGQQDGECWKYYKDCPKSLFISENANKYRKDETFHENEESSSPTVAVETENSVNVMPPHLE